MTQDQRRFPQEECMYCGGPIYQDSEMHVSMHDKLLEQARLSARAEAFEEAAKAVSTRGSLGGWSALHNLAKEARAKLGETKS